jgi:AcrR family transcriptional regulator
MNRPTGRGRKPGNPATRSRIEDAARARFLAEGYRDVTLRAVAADAAVDVALISYYFGSKQGLFGAAMALPVNPIDAVTEVLAGDPATLVPRLMGTALAVWDSPDAGSRLRALAATATTDPDQNRLVREAVGREIVERLAERLEGPDARARAGALVSQLAGIIFTRYLLRLEPIASMAPEEIIRRLGPSLALALRPDDDSGGGPVTDPGAADSPRPPDRT